MNETTLAYLAGAIDSDGTIGIKRSTYSMRIVGDSSQATYSERVALRQVTPDIPTMLRDAFGGSLYITQPTAKNGRPLWSWAATDIKAIGCISAIFPFLRVKLEQAENCIALRKIKEDSKKDRVAFGRKHVGASRRSQSYTDEMERLYLRAKELNRVGR